MYIACSKCETMKMANTALSIKFLMLEQTRLVEVHQRLCHVYGVSVVVSLHTVEWWHKKSAKGCTSIDNAAWSGRPTERINETVHCVHALLEEDCHYTTTDSQVQMAAWYAQDVSHVTIHIILCEHLQMSKECARWVPWQLTEMNQKLCMG